MTDLRKNATKAALHYTIEKLANAVKWHCCSNVVELVPEYLVQIEYWLEELRDCR